MDKKTPSTVSAPPDSTARAKRPAGVRVSSPKCVRCGKLVDARHRPFCSQRCADIDLGAWVTGAYRVETDEAVAEESDGAGPKPSQ